MKRLLLLLLFVAAVLGASAQQVETAEVYLRDGRIVRGRIVEHLSRHEGERLAFDRLHTNHATAQPLNDAFTEAQTPDGSLAICVASQDWPMSL